MNENELLNQVKSNLDTEPTDTKNTMFLAFQSFIKTVNVKEENSVNLLTSKESTYENVLNSKLEEMKLSGEPIFCITPDLFWKLQNGDYGMKSLLEKKNVDYKWAGKSGILITKSNLLKLMQVVFRSVTGMSLSFNSEKNGIKWNEVFILRRVDKATVTDYRTKSFTLVRDYSFEEGNNYLLNIVDNDNIHLINSGFVNLQKYMKNVFQMTEEYKERCIKRYNIKRKYEKLKEVWITRADLEKKVGWVKDPTNPNKFNHDWYANQIFRLGGCEGEQWNEIGTEVEDFEFTVEFAQRILKQWKSTRDINLSDLLSDSN